MKKIYETVADIAYMAGQRGYYSGDSRADMQQFIAWAEEFEGLHAGVDWNESELDYMWEIEAFAAAKLQSRPENLPTA